MGFFEIIDSIWQSIFSVPLTSWGSLLGLLCLGSAVALVLIVLLLPIIGVVGVAGDLMEGLVSTIGKGIVAVVVIGSIAVVGWAVMNPGDATAEIMGTIPTTPPQEIPTDQVISENPSTVPDQPIPSNGICWSYELQGFAGTRWRAWEMIAKEQVGDVMEWEQFKTEVVARNEILLKDDYEFFDEKTYFLPEKCP